MVDFISFLTSRPVRSGRKLTNVGGKSKIVGRKNQRFADQTTFWLTIPLWKRIKKAR